MKLECANVPPRARERRAGGFDQVVSFGMFHDESSGSSPVLRACSRRAILAMSPV